jgi:hypothetical protein
MKIIRHNSFVFCNVNRPSVDSREPEVLCVTLWYGGGRRPPYVRRLYGEEKIIILYYCITGNIIC